MNKCLSLTALLFLAGPTLLTYGAGAISPRELREVQELAPELARSARSLLKLFTPRATKLIWPVVYNGVHEVADKISLKVTQEVTQAVTQAVTQRINQNINHHITHMAIEAIIQEVLQRYFSSYISKKIHHYLLNGQDVTALFSTAISAMLCVMASSPPKNANECINVSKNLGIQLTGKYVGHKFVTTSIYAINWCHRTLREGDLIGPGSIMVMKTLAGYIGSFAGRMIIVEYT